MDYVGRRDKVLVASGVGLSVGQRAMADFDIRSQIRAMMAERNSLTTTTLMRLLLVTRTNTRLLQS